MRTFFYFVTWLVLTGPVASAALAAAPLPDGAIARLGTVDLRNRQRVTGVAFSPDGRYLASVGWGDSIRLWDVNTAAQARRIKPGGMSFAVAFSPDSTKLASVGDRSVRLWDLEKNEEVFSSDRHPGRIFSIAYAPDGLTFATAGDDMAVRLWDATTGDELVKLYTRAGGRDAHPVAYSPDGRLLASGDKNGEVNLWHLDTGAIQRFTIAEQNRGVTSLAFTRDGENIVAAGEAYDRENRTFVRNVSLWDVDTGEKSGVFEAEEVPRSGSCSLAVAEDGASVVTLHREQVVIWDLATRKPRRIIETFLDSFGSRTHGVAISPNGKTIASKGPNNKVHLWDAETGEELFPQRDSHHGGVLAIDTSPDGELIVTGGEDGALHLWNDETYQHLRRLERTGSWIRSVRFFPDGERIVAVGEWNNPDTHRFEGLALIIRVTDGKLFRRMNLADRGMQADVSPEGRFLAVAIGLGMNAGFGNDGARPPQILLWNLTAEQDEPAAFPSGKGEVKQLTFDARGSDLYTAHDGTEIRRLQVANGMLQEISRVADERRFGPSIAFSLAGQSVLCGGLKSSRKPGASRGLLQMTELHADGVVWSSVAIDSRPTRIAIAPDGGMYAAFYRALTNSNSQHRLVIGHVRDGIELKSFELTDGSVRSLAFSRDGAKLFSGMDRGDTLVWEIPE